MNAWKGAVRVYGDDVPCSFPISWSLAERSDGSALPRTTRPRLLRAGGASHCSKARDGLQNQGHAHATTQLADGRCIAASRVPAHCGRRRRWPWIRLLLPCTDPAGMLRSNHARRQTAPHLPDRRMRGGVDACRFASVSSSASRFCCLTLQMAVPKRTSTPVAPGDSFRSARPNSPCNANRQAMLVPSVCATAI